MGEIFAVGDVVQLKSGGPKMTVVEHRNPVGDETIPHLWCKWFDGDAQQAGYFPAAALLPAGAAALATPKQSPRLVS